ncbi:hypothetical protein X975_04380, partial [Stegodyphus mimosarum]
MATVISWNCRGFHQNFLDIRRIVNIHHPLCLALQETNLKPEQQAKLRSFSFGRKDNLSCEHASGGVGLLTSLDYPSDTLPLTSSLQVVVIWMNFQILVSVVSLCLPPNEYVDQQHLNDLIESLETVSATQSATLLGLEKLGQINVNVSVHNTLNFSRGVISEIDLLSVSEEEIVSELSDQNVCAARQIKMRKDDQFINTK